MLQSSRTEKRIIQFFAARPLATRCATESAANSPTAVRAVGGSSLALRDSPDADTSGMHLVDPAASRFDEQLIYLDFDGAKDVTYDGPVKVEGIDVPAFKAPAPLTARNTPSSRMSSLSFEPIS